MWEGSETETEIVHALCMQYMRIQKIVAFFIFVDTIIMKITFDQQKRDVTFETRGLAFEDAATVFNDRTLDQVDDRFNYGEERIITIGYLDSRMVVVVWTERGEARHVISMRKANEREKNRFAQRLGQS